VPGPDSFVVLPAALVAYSPGPGLELIPYFVGLVTWAGLAFAAIFLAPITAFVRRLCRIWRGVPADAPKNVATELVPKSPPEGPRE
jgi:hypothetical protein